MSEELTVLGNVVKGGLGKEVTVGVVFNFLSSVLPQQIFETVDQCSSLVTAQSFIRQTKDSPPSRHEGRLTPKERPQSSFYMFCLLPSELALCKLG